MYVQKYSVVIFTTLFYFDWPRSIGIAFFGSSDPPPPPPPPHDMTNENSASAKPGSSKGCEALLRSRTVPGALASYS
jgi:hypothetical protein